MGIVDEPRLVVETVLEVVDDKWQHIMVGRYNSQIGAILCFLESNELLHSQLFVQHAATAISYLKHIGVAGITLQLPDFRTKHLTDKIE